MIRLIPWLRRFMPIERAVAAGVDAHVDVWEGMAHGFLSGIGTMDAPTQALDAIGEFLTGRLTISE